MPNLTPRRDFIRRFATGAALSAVTIPEVMAEPASSSEQTSTTARPFFNVLDLGAIADGKSDCTSAIQKTIDACAQAGGGKVLFPAGRYLTAPIFLKSNIHVEVLAGATLLFTSDFNRVPSVTGRGEGIDRTVYASLFTGLDLENVSITGRGTLDGQGEAWWNAFRTVRDMRRRMGLDEREPENPPGLPLKWGRPRMINLYRCKNVLISGLKIINSPSWNIHPVLCENVCIDGVTIIAPPDSPNTDGIDPDSCRNVRISNCSISVGDDCIIIKSGYRYNKDGVASSSIAITNCVFGTGHAGVGIGSETAGGVWDVVITNCICQGTDRGLRFKTARGRGNVIENVRASNCVMRDVGEAITVTAFYVGGDRHAAQPVDERTPMFRNLHFSEIIAKNVKQAALIEGLPEMPIQGLSIRNMVVDGAAKGIDCVNATSLVFDNVVVTAENGPALHADSVQDLEICRLTSSGQHKSSDPVIRMENVNQALVQSCAPQKGTGTFLELKGIANREISLVANRLKHAAREVELVDGASMDAISRSSS